MKQFDHFPTINRANQTHPNPLPRMPRFSQADEAFLKRTMLPRAPACFYTPEDVELSVRETGKKKEDVQHWARQLRWKASIDKLPNRMGILDFLNASPESLDGKVPFSVDHSQNDASTQNFVKLVTWH